MRRERGKGRNKKNRRCFLEPLEPRILLSGDGLGHDDLTPVLGQGLLEPLCREAEADTLQVSLALDDSQLQQPADSSPDVCDSTLTAQAPQLPGLQLIDPDTSCFQGQVFWLDFEGAEDVTYNGPVTVGPFDVSAFRAPEPFSGQEAEIVSEVTTSLNHLFAGTGVAFVENQPVDGSEYSTLYIGGDGAPFSDYGTFNGLTEQVDYGNQDRADDGFVFPQNVSSDQTDLDAYLTDLGQVIAHEAAHLLGYGHTGGDEQAGSLSEVANAEPVTYDLLGYYCYESPDPAWWGQRVSVVLNIKNAGTGTVWASFDVELWLSNDQTFGDADDLLLKTYLQESEVPAGGCTPTFEVPFYLPSKPPSGYPENGTVYIGMKTDSANVIAETNEANNFGQIGHEADWDTFTVIGDFVPPTAPGIPDLTNRSDTAPTGVTTGPLKTDNTTRDTTPTFQWTPATDASGISSYWCAIDDAAPEFGGSWIGKPGLGWGSVVEWTPTVEANGPHTLYVKAVDDSPAHNIGEASTLSFIIDTKKPSVATEASPIDGQVTTDTTPTLDWNASSDSRSGVYQYQVQVDGDWAFGSADREVWVASPTTQWDVAPALPSGYWYWRVRAQDVAGNTGSWSEVEGAKDFIVSELTKPSAPGTPNLTDESDTAPAGITSGTLKTDNITKDPTPTFQWTPATDASGISGYYCMLDDADAMSKGTWMPRPAEGWGLVVECTPAVKFDGSHTLYVRAVDDSPAHNIGEASSRSFIIDTGKPSEPTLASPTDRKVTTDTTPTLDWNASTDSRSGVYQYQVQVDDDAAFASVDRSKWVGSSTTAWDVTPALPSGYWFWRVRAQDKAGNTGGWSAMEDFIVSELTKPSAPGTPNLIDESDTAPTGITTGLLKTDNITKDMAPTFQWTPASDASGIYGYWCAVDDATPEGGTWIGEPPGGWGSVVEYTCLDLMDGVDGSYTFYVKAMDDSPAHNIGSASSLSFIIDKGKPSEPTLASPIDGKATTDTTPTLDWNGSSDSRSGVYQYQVVVDDDAAFGSLDRSKWVNSPTTQWDLTSALGLGTWYWRVRAQDVAGNSGSWSAIEDFIISEGTPPSLPGTPYLLDDSDTAPTGITTGLLKTDNITKDTTPTFQWTPATDASGISGYWCAIDDATPEGGTWIGEPVGGWGSVVEWTPTVKANGSHTLYVKAVDDSPAHNIGSSSSLSFTIDTGKPSIPTLASPIDGKVTTDSTPTLDWNASTDSLSGMYQYQVVVDDDSAFGSFNRAQWVASPTTAWDVTPALPAKTWYWRVRAQDKAGNLGSWSAGEDFVIEPAGLIAASAPENGGNGSGASPLTSEALAPIVEEAILRWTEILHLNETSLALLHEVTFQVTDLEGLTLGQTLGTVVTIDMDAADYGWFIDSTPSSDSEFQRQAPSGQLLATPSSPAYGEMDLLTVAMHELGHVLGYADLSPTESSPDLMVATLEAGERRPVSDSHGHPRVAMEGTKQGLPSALQPAKPWLLDFLTDGAWSAYDHPNERIRIVI